MRCCLVPSRTYAATTCSIRTTSAINYNNPGLTVFGGVQFALPAD